MNAFSETMIDVVMESICFLIRCFHLLVVGLRPKLDPPSSAEDRSCLKIATCVKSTSLTLISNSNSPKPGLPMRIAFDIGSFRHRKP